MRTSPWLGALKWRMAAPGEKGRLKVRPCQICRDPPIRCIAPAQAAIRTKTKRVAKGRGFRMVGQGFPAVDWDFPAVAVWADRDFPAADRDFPAVDQVFPVEARVLSAVGLVLPS